MLFNLSSQFSYSLKVLGVGRKPLCNRRKTQFLTKIEDRRNMRIESYLYHGIHRYTKVYYEYDNYQNPK